MASSHVGQQLPIFWEGQVADDAEKPTPSLHRSRSPPPPSLFGQYHVMIIKLNEFMKSSSFIRERVFTHIHWINELLPIK